MRYLSHTFVLLLVVTALTSCVADIADFEPAELNLADPANGPMFFLEDISHEAIGAFTVRSTLIIRSNFAELRPEQQMQIIGVQVGEGATASLSDARGRFTWRSRGQIANSRPCIRVRYRVEPNLLSAPTEICYVAER